jgi:hypothetical protein
VTGPGGLVSAMSDSGSHRGCEASTAEFGQKLAAAQPPDDPIWPDQLWIASLQSCTGIPPYATTDISWPGALFCPTLGLAGT